MSVEHIGKHVEQLQSCMMQRQNLEAIFNSVADGIIAVDIDLRVSNLNEAAQHIIGYTRQEAVGESCADVLGDGSQEGLCALFAQRCDANGVEVAIVDRQGRRRHLTVSTRILRDEDAEERGVVAIVRDNTELETLRQQLEARGSFHDMVGKDHRMREVYQLVDDLSDSDATVLILGESGTGKELVASAVHGSSHRKDGPFVKVNCSALSENLLESELFGHVRGAFTGAVRDKLGRFERAHGGTIFLDEIGDISSGVQLKLLRVLQEREIERVGSSDTIAVDVRVIAATNRDLRTLIAEGRFREDLFYRLHVMPIELPPLRQRKEDIPLLVQHFIDIYNARTGRQIEAIDHAALAVLLDHEWPGNVRELENAIEHAFIKCRGQVLMPECLPAHLHRERPVGSVPLTAPRRPERERVVQALEQCHWNRSDAAEVLGMHRTTLWRKMKEWGLG